MFQSTPDLINRENALNWLSYARWILFQSTPDLINRENNAERIAIETDYVSIHSRFN